MLSRTDSDAHDPAQLAVLGEQPHPGGDRVADGDLIRTCLPWISDLARVDLGHAEDRLQDLGPAGAHQAREAQDLAPDAGRS